tara:strand:- start:647 stop:1087 length:441 start_codon:yes stop_codon:yes gene_type:complete
MSKTDTTESYWDNNGKYQKMYNKAWKQLIPASGEAEDGWPEALRAISRIGYDYYNNGFCNLWQGWEDLDDYGEEVMVYKMDSYYEDMVEYLRIHIPYEMYMELDTFLHDAKGYGNWSNQAGIIDRIIDYIMEGIGEDGLLEEELVS